VCVGATIHDVQLRQHANRPFAGRIHLLREPERIARRDVRVGGRNSEYDCILALNELTRHVLDVAHDARGLSLNRHLRQSRQVNEREVRHRGTADGEVDWIRTDAVLSETAMRLRVNLPAYLLVVVKFLIFFVEKRSILLLRAGRLNELQQQRASRDDSRATRQKVVPHHRLKHRALSRALPANDDDTWQRLPQAWEFHTTSSTVRTVATTRVAEQRA